MSHIGVLSYKGAGHLNPLAALSRELCARGHRVTFFDRPELEERVQKYGVEFCPVGTPSSQTQNENPPDADGASAGKGDASHKRIISEIEMSLRETPAALKKAGVEALIVDEIIFSGPTIAELLNVPYFVISTSIPPGFGWDVTEHGSEDTAQNAHASVRTSLDEVTSGTDDPLLVKIDAFRRRAGLRPLCEMQRAFPPIAHIAQLPRCLDFPRSGLPANFYYAGPLVRESVRAAVKFPWDRLDDRPVVYASLGTARNVEPGEFRLIAETCDQAAVQLVISLGGRGEPQLLDGLPGDPLVVKEAPQLELLKRASAVVTHGGLNTVLETLLEGLPMVVIPAAYDQPAVAARLKWLGAAEVIPAGQLSAQRFSVAMKKVLEDRSYRDAAADLQTKIRAARGLERATDLIDIALKTPAARASSQRTTACSDKR